MGTMLVCSCGKPESKPAISDPEKTPTQISHNHKILQSQDGKKNYRFETPLLEKYDEAKEPFIEFRKGIKVETFGSADTIESDIIADYAHFDINKQLWEARGNVVARNIKEDKVLYTEQLFWDQVKKKIYTDKPAKVYDRGRLNKGMGFEADESFQSWQFNRGRGQIEIDTTKSSLRDSTDIAATDTSVSGTATTTNDRVK